MKRAVLDASALVAFIRGEPGADRLKELVPNSMVSAVNYSEALQKANMYGDAGKRLKAVVANLDVEIVPFDTKLAEETAKLFPLTEKKDVSFADRSCLALASVSQSPVITSDRAWVELGLGVEVILFRRPIN